jgi:hypothetical protein
MLRKAGKELLVVVVMVVECGCGRLRGSSWRGHCTRTHGGIASGHGHGSSHGFLSPKLRRRTNQANVGHGSLHDGNRRLLVGDTASTAAQDRVARSDEEWRRLCSLYDGNDLWGFVDSQRRISGEKVIHTHPAEFCNRGIQTCVRGRVRADSVADSESEFMRL